MVEEGFASAAPDWHPDGRLTAPGNRVPPTDLSNAIEMFWENCGDLRMTITSAFEPVSG